MDFEAQINKKGFELVALVNELSEVLQTDDITDYIGTPPNIGTLTDVKQAVLSCDDAYGNKISAYIHTDNSDSQTKAIGLNEDSYKQLKLLVSDLLDEPKISKYTDVSFLETRVFNWVTDVYKSKFAAKELFSYIYDEMDKELKEYAFYFKILSLGIKEPYTLGSASITYISDANLEEWEWMFVNKAEDYRSNILKVLQFYKDVPLIRVKKYGIEAKARSLALREAELIVNAMKLFFIKQSLKKHIKIFDLDYKIANNESKSFSAIVNTEILNFKMSGNGAPIFITPSGMKSIQDLGFSIILEFIHKNKRDALGLLIEDGVMHLGGITSTENLYERTVKLVTFFEGFLVPQLSTKAKGETILKSFISQLPDLAISLEEYKQVIRINYEIRNKYLHNRIELPLDLSNIYYFQSLALSLLLFLIQKSDEIGTIDQMQEFLTKQSTGV